MRSETKKDLPRKATSSAAQGFHDDKPVTGTNKGMTLTESLKRKAEDFEKRIAQTRRELNARLAALEDGSLDFNARLEALEYSSPSGIPARRRFLIDFEKHVLNIQNQNYDEQAMSEDAIVHQGNAYLDALV